MVGQQHQERISRPSQMISPQIARRPKRAIMRFAKAGHRELTRAQIRELITRTWDQDLEVMLYLKDR